MCTRPTARSRGRKTVAAACSRRRKTAAAGASVGFTIIEVIAALALIVFLIGGVYSVGNGTMVLGASMSRSRITETRITSFAAQWREYLETLPAGIVFSAKDRALLIENGTVPFAWHRAIRRADAVEFAVARRDGAAGGDFLVRHLKRPERPTSADEYKVVAELPLLEGIREWEWRFYEPLEKKWLSSWDAKKRPQPPLFMRLRFAFVDDPRSFEYTFWVANDVVTLQNPQVPIQMQNPQGQAPAQP